MAVKIATAACTGTIGQGDEVVHVFMNIQQVTTPAGTTLSGSIALISDETNVSAAPFSVEFDGAITRIHSKPFDFVNRMTGARTPAAIDVTLQQGAAAQCGFVVHPTNSGRGAPYLVSSNGLQPLTSGTVSIRP